MSLRNAMCDQAGHRPTTGMVLTQHLTEKNPQCDQRRIDSVQPANIDCRQCLRDDPLREDVAERQISVLQKLTSQEAHLLPKPSLVRILHPCGLLAGDGVVDKHHLRERGLFAYINVSQEVTEEVRAIRHIDREQFRAFKSGWAQSHLSSKWWRNNGIPVRSPVMPKVPEVEPSWVIYFQVANLIRSY